MSDEIDHLCLGVPGSATARDGDTHLNGYGASKPCPDDGLDYYLSSDRHLWIPLWTLHINQREADRALPDWGGAYPKGGGA